MILDSDHSNMAMIIGLHFITQFWQLPQHSIQLWKQLHTSKYCRMKPT